MLNNFLEKIENFTPLLVLTGLVLAAIFHFSGLPHFADQVLFWILLFGCLPFLINMAISFWHREFGVDLIAAVGILSSLLIGEYLAGSVILLMLSGGEALENFAIKTAKKELTHLISHAPTTAHMKKGSRIQDITVDQIAVGDVIVVKPNEVIPVDGVIVEGTSSVDESALTGESLPVEKRLHMTVMSGSINQDNVLEVRATHLSKDSKYAQIIRLVQEAEKNKAPFVRLADRYSVWFTLVAFGLAGVGWYLAGDPVRALSVLVVATPCPLLLATPIAFTSGISRAANRGIIIKSGSALEKLSRAKSFLFDKTGTLTLGVPEVAEIHTFGSSSEKEVAAVAASIDQLSTHILGQSLLQYAHHHRLPLTYPSQFSETVGNGVMGVVKKHRYYLGKLDYLSKQDVPVTAALKKDYAERKREGMMIVYLADHQKVLGVLTFKDTVRPRLKDFFTDLSRKVKKIVMVTGDKKQIAEDIAAEAGIQEVIAECLPEDKLKVVRNLQKESGPVVMVGDGVNDAPALAAADVGIALGARGSTAASEAGDIVILIDKFERVFEALKISQRVMHIAKESIFVGIGLSIGLMFLATLGYIKPVYGAIYQEIIDVIVILNALRVYVNPFGKMK